MSAGAGTIDSWAVVALGSNWGTPVVQVREAIRALRRGWVGAGASAHADADAGASALLCSSLWRSTPVDCPPGSPMFVNAAVALRLREGDTPELLFASLQRLEQASGRPAVRARHAPRTLDLDLIAFGAERRHGPDLVLPHPRAHERRFVLQPLSELGPDWVLPGQPATVAQLLTALKTEETLERIACGPP